ncbi:MAG TPA: DUF167 domain-containing protein [Candidatus Dormibacteraeota bacterium]|nr:DUF167 domain-containing protein [Candidatus Dormibacteraeota bacterium]
MRLKLRVTPKSRADEIVGMREDGALHVRVSAAPESGKANRAVLRLLREKLGLPGGTVRLKAGASSRDKWVELDGIDAAELTRRLEADRT